MRILADTNLYISHLLNPGRAGAVKSLFQAAVDGQITLLLPQVLLAEVITAATTKPYLSQRIDSETLDALLTILSLVAEEVPGSIYRCPTIPEITSQFLLIILPLLFLSNFNSKCITVEALDQ